VFGRGKKKAIYQNKLADGIDLRWREEEFELF
jgi:hypothetical protein